MEPSSQWMYVTLLSNTSKPEFRENTPAPFKVRLPYPLRIKNWWVGVAGVYLPGAPYAVSHGVTSHPVTHPSVPLTEHRQSNLYKRLVRMYSRALKGTRMDPSSIPSRPVTCVWRSNSGPPRTPTSPSWCGGNLIASSTSLTWAP